MNASNDPDVGVRSVRTAPIEPPTGAAITVLSDLTCPWAHVLVRRLADVRRRSGLDREVVIDHRALPLELLNRQPTPKAEVDRAISACQGLAPEVEWSTEPDPYTYPVSSLPGLEAVQAAKSQGVDKSEALDLALRAAVFGEWRCISVHAVVLEIAATVPELDVDALWKEILSGQPHAEVWHHYRVARDAGLGVSPTVVLSNGTMIENPGIEMHQDDDGTIVVDRDDPSVVEDLVLAAAGRVAAE